MKLGTFFKVLGKVVVALSAPAASKKPKTFPLMTMDTIDSNDKPISTATAIKLYKEFMLAIGHLEKDELADHAKYFSDAIKEQLEALTEESKGNLEHIKEQIKQAKEMRKGAVIVGGKEDIDEEIESLQDDLAFEMEELKNSKAELAAFRLDKRKFLIEYVNQETQ